MDDRHLVCNALPVETGNLLRRKCTYGNNPLCPAHGPLHEKVIGPAPEERRLIGIPVQNEIMNGHNERHRAPERHVEMWRKEKLYAALTEERGHPELLGYRIVGNSGLHDRAHPRDVLQPLFVAGTDEEGEMGISCLRKKSGNDLARVAADAGMPQRKTAIDSYLSHRRLPSYPDAHSRCTAGCNTPCPRERGAAFIPPQEE